MPPPSKQIIVRRYIALFVCSAFKHYKRAEFTNKNLVKATVDFLDKLGVHWLWLTGIE